MELLDLVTEEDQIVGSMFREKIYEQRLSNFRTINAFIINENQKFWIPTRHPNKSLNPGLLDASVGGHVKMGETYDQAFIRETREEVNLDLSHIPWRYIGKFTPNQHGVSSYMQVYFVYYNKTPHYNAEDYVDFFWGNIDEIYGKMMSGINAKKDLFILLSHLRTVM